MQDLMEYNSPEFRAAAKAERRRYRAEYRANKRQVRARLRAGRRRLALFGSA